MSGCQTRAFRGDRGDLGLTVALTILAVSVALAAAAAVVAAKSDKPDIALAPPPAIVINLVDATAARNGMEDPFVKIKFDLALPARPRKQYDPDVFRVEVTCQVTAPYQDPHRQTETYEMAPGTSRYDKMTVTLVNLNFSHLNATRAVRADVFCHAIGPFGDAFTEHREVVVPRPPTVDAALYAGQYSLVFRLTKGDPAQCETPVFRTVEVIQKEGLSAHIRVELSGSAVYEYSSFDAFVGSNLEFAGHVFLRPADTGWGGHLDATFGTSHGSMSGTWTRDDGACKYAFATETVRAVTLQDGLEIEGSPPGTKGCQVMITDNDPIPAGPFTFAITNASATERTVTIRDPQQKVVHTQALGSGDLENAPLTLVPGTYTIECGEPSWGPTSLTVH